MTKAELIEQLHKTGDGEVSKRVLNELVDHLFETVGAVIKKESRFSYPAFGTFSVRKRKARKGRNPQTGEEIKIPAGKTVVFKPSSKLKEKL